MVILTAHKHTKAVLLWYFTQEPLSIAKGTLAYARAMLEIIPIPFLLLTLLSPWKNIHERKKGHGFSLDLWFERLVMNVFSRVVGMVVRLITIVLGLALQIVILTIGVAYFLLWIAFPAITLTAVFLVLRSFT